MYTRFDQEGYRHPINRRVVLEVPSLANMRPVEWAIPDYIPIGCLTLIAAGQKHGKGHINASHTAWITRGGNSQSWPDPTSIKPGKVMYVIREEDFKNTITPRLQAAGADFSRVRNLKGIKAHNGQIEKCNWSDEHLEQVLREAQEFGDVRMIVVDPWMQVVQGDAASNQKVQFALERLAGLAKDLQCAIVIVAHVKVSAKGKDGVTSRVAGPLALTGVPRNVLLIAKINKTFSELEGDFVLVRTGNFNKGDGGRTFSIVSSVVVGDCGPIETSKIAWLQHVDGEAADVLEMAEVTRHSNRRTSPIEAAIEFLMRILKDGRRLLPEIRTLANDEGISFGTLKRAKIALGILDGKQKGAGQFSPFWWCLPSDQSEADAE